MSVAGKGHGATTGVSSVRTPVRPTYCHPRIMFGEFYRLHPEVRFCHCHSRSINSLDGPCYALDRTPGKSSRDEFYLTRPQTNSPTRFSPTLLSRGLFQSTVYKSFEVKSGHVYESLVYCKTTF